MIKVVILTISDSRMQDNDLSAKAIKELLEQNSFEIAGYEIIKDDKNQIKEKLIHYADSTNTDLILTNGGTGLGPRDLTPEATLEVIGRQVPGISEFMRTQGSKKTKRAILSRGVCGIRKSTIIINLPGSPKGAKESLECILEIIPHTFEMLKGMGH